MFKVLISIFLLSNIALIQGQDQGCQICEAVIGEAKGLLQNNATEVQILNFLKTNVCGLVSGELNQACVQLIDQQGPGIISALANDLNPQQVCTSLGLCKKIAQFKQQQLSRKAPANCFTCEVLVGQVENYVLTNQTEAQVISTLENKLCPALGSLAATCKSLVEQYGPVIFQLLKSGISPQKVCELIGQCPKPPRKAIVQAPKPKAPTNCFTCKLLVGQVENLVLNNQTESQIITTLETKLCPALGSLAATCKQLVDTYGPQIIDKLEAGVSPEKVCEYIGQCPKPPRKSAVVQAPKPKAANCVTCKLLVGQIEAQLLNNQTESQIITTLETKLCPALGSLAATCKQIVEQYGPMIFEKLEAGVSPEKVCELIGQCTPPPRKVQVQAPKPRAPNCFTCELLVGQVENLVLNNQTETQIITTLETKLCPALGSLSATCKQLVEQYGPMIIEKLKSGISPEKVCELIGQCPKPPRKAAIVVQAAPKPRAQNCVTCKLVVGQIENYILSNQTESQVINTLETKLCPALGSLSATCKQLVEQYGPMIFQVLSSGLSPEKVCELINQCPKPSRHISASKFSFLKGSPVDQHPIIQTKDIQPPLDAEESN